MNSPNPSLEVPAHMLPLYHEDKKRFRNVTNVFQKAGFFRLPAEIQLRIAFWVGRCKGVSRIDRFLSQEVYNFRLVSKRFASLGATQLASHATKHPKSAYKSVLVDFTEHSLRTLEAITKNNELKKSITSVYFILWRWAGEDVYMRDETLLGIEYRQRKQSRQDFFARPSHFKRLEKLLAGLPELKERKWIENDISVQFFGRRPHRYALTSSTAELSEPYIEDSFQRSLSMYAALQEQFICLSNVFENLTHLHLLSTRGQPFWPTIDPHIWAALVHAMSAIKCLRIEGDENELNWVTLAVNEFPHLRKLIVSHLDGELLAQFIETNGSYLEDIRIRHLHDLDADQMRDLLVTMRKHVAHAQVSFIVVADLEVDVVDRDMLNLLSHVDVDDRNDYGPCVMKETNSSSAYNVDTSSEDVDKNNGSDKDDGETALSAAKITANDLDMDDDEDGVQSIISGTPSL